MTNKKEVPSRSTISTFLNSSKTFLALKRKIWPRTIQWHLPDHPSIWITDANSSNPLSLMWLEATSRSRLIKFLLQSMITRNTILIDSLIICKRRRRYKNGSARCSSIYLLASIWRSSQSYFSKMGTHFFLIIFYRILLAEVIGHLEGTKIENIQMNPKSQASCL